MRRGLLSLLILLAPVVALLNAAGCEDKVESFEASKQIHETEPQPAAPGEPVVE